MKDTKIITIANRKGGAGKSTCAVHIASEATKRNYKTILIDLDPQKTTEQWWKKRNDNNPYLAEINPSNISEEIIKLKKFDFDLCIIDTPGDLSINSSNGINIADLVIIPSKPTAPDLGAIGRTIYQVSEEAKKPFFFVLTQAIARAKVTLQGSSILSKYGQVAPSILTNRISYVNAMNSGTSAAEEDKIAAEELKQLWNFIELELFGLINNENKNVKEKIRLNI